MLLSLFLFFSTKCFLVAWNQLEENVSEEKQPEIFVVETEEEPDPGGERVTTYKLREKVRMDTLMMVPRGNVEKKGIIIITMMTVGNCELNDRGFWLHYWWSDYVTPNSTASEDL